MSARQRAARAVAMLLFAAMLLAAPRVLAQPDPVLPLGDIDRSAIAVVPGAEPSPSHRMGTAIVLGAPDKALVAQEWDLADKTLLQKRSLATLPASRALVAERVGGEIFVVIAAANDADDDDEVTLFSFDPSLALRGRQTIGRGSFPSLAVNDRYVVTGFHERHEPLVTRTSADERAAPAGLALHVSVRDRATMQVVGSRVMQGDELLYTTVLKERSMHAIALDGDRATIALTGLAKIIVTSVTMPSLRSVVATRFAGLGDIEAAPVFTLPGHRVLLDLVSGRRVLGSALEAVDHGPFVASPSSCARPVPAWRTHVAICGGTTIDEGPAPARLTVRR